SSTASANPTLPTHRLFITVLHCYFVWSKPDDRLALQSLPLAFHPPASAPCQPDVDLFSWASLSVSALRAKGGLQMPVCADSRVSLSRLQPPFPASKPCLSFDEPLDIIGTEAEALPRQFHLLQLTAPRQGVDGLHFEAQHDCDLFRFEQTISLEV